MFMCMCLLDSSGITLQSTRATEKLKILWPVTVGLVVFPKTSFETSNSAEKHFCQYHIITIKKEKKASRPNRALQAYSALDNDT